MTDSSDQPSPSAKKQKKILMVPQTEWEAAKAFFSDPKNIKEVKFRRKRPEAGSLNSADQNLPDHSFIKVNGQIYAIANKQAAYGHLLGEGGFGKVKMVQNELGERFAVKVEGRGLRGENDTETKIMKLLNYLEGEAARPVSARHFKNRPITEKLYTLTKLRNGYDLFSHIYFDKLTKKRRERSYERRLNMALHSAYALKNLHANNIIHADIKPENFMATINDDQMLIESIDYGLSLIVPSGQTAIQQNRRAGTRGYMAPELLLTKPIHYSFASDIFALGTMLSHDLQLLSLTTEDSDTTHMINKITANNKEIEHLIKKMLDSDPTNRPTIDKVIKILEQNLALMAQINERKLLLKEVEKYKGSLEKKQSGLKYKVGKPLRLSKIDKRVEQAENLEFVISKIYPTHAAERAVIETIQKEIKAWRLPGKNKSKLEKIIERLEEIEKNQVAIYAKKAR